MTTTKQNRADEWHITIDPETKRRLKIYAAMHGLTLAKAIKQLLDQDAASDAVTA